METRTATISADDIQEREVLYVRYQLNQQTDVEGQPTGTTRGGKIFVKVKSKDDGNTEILEWMIDNVELIPWSGNIPYCRGAFNISQECPTDTGP